jgi:hypothetical protein
VFPSPKPGNNLIHIPFVAYYQALCDIFPVFCLAFYYTEIRGRLLVGIFHLYKGVCHDQYIATGSSAAYPGADPGQFLCAGF